MNYISYSLSCQNKIKDAILELMGLGFSDIELSGGTSYYEVINEDIIGLKQKYKLNFRIHNYFPPMTTSNSSSHRIGPSSIGDIVIFQNTKWLQFRLRARNTGIPGNIRSRIRETFTDPDTGITDKFKISVIKKR